MGAKFTDWQVGDYCFVGTDETPRIICGIGPYQGEDKEKTEVLVREWPPHRKAMRDTITKGTFEDLFCIAQRDIMEIDNWVNLDSIDSRLRFIEGEV